MSKFFENLKAKSQEQEAIEPATETNPRYFESLKQSQEYQQQPEPVPEESRLGYGVRQVARTGARAGETLAGMAGDIVRPAQDLLENFMSKVITGKPITDEQKQQIRKFYAESEEGMQPFPTSQEIKEAHEPVTKEYLKPESPAEEKADEITQDIISQLPSGFVKSIVSSTLGQGTKYLAKGLGAEEETANIAKSGSMFLTGLWNPKGAKNLTSRLYAAREAAIPVSVTGDATKLESKMLRLANNMRRSGKNIAASEKEIAEAAENIVTEMQSGQLSYQKAASIKRSLNEKAQKFLYETPDKAAKARARNKFAEINHELERFIATSQSKYPAFYKAHKNADNVFRTLAAGQGLSKFLEANLPKGLSTVSEKIASAIIKPGILTYHMFKSPQLRRLYLQTIGSAAAKNTQQMSRNFRRLEKESEQNPEIRKILNE